MTVYLVTLVSVLALQSTLALKHLEQPRWKSFLDAELECAEYLFIPYETLERYQCSRYPNEPSSHKLLYCILTNLNAWDNDQQEVKDYVFSQFFIPSDSRPSDCHTKECLHQNLSLLRACDVLGRAYQTFQCYKQNYANISQEVKWIPYHFSEVVQTVYDCMHIENFSPQSLLDFCQGRIATNPDYPTLAYCFFTRSNLYTTRAGMNLDKLYAQFGVKELLSDDTKRCEKEAAEQYSNEPERIGHIVVDCLLKYLPAASDIGTAASNALGNPPECDVPPSPPPKIQPCYGRCA